MTTEQRFRAVQRALYAGANTRSAIPRRNEDVLAMFRLRFARLRPGASTEELNRHLRFVAEGARMADVPHFADNERDAELMLWPAYRSMTAVVEEVLARESSPAAWSAPPLGTLPNFSPNACCLRLDDGDAVVIAVSSGLPQFLNRMSKIVTTVHAAVDGQTYDDGRGREDWPAAYRTLVDREIDLRPALADRFARTFAAFYDGTVEDLAPHDMVLEFAPDVGDDPPIGDVVADVHRGVLLTGAERFILGHELAHLVLGHLDRPTRDVDVSEHTVRLLEESHQREHEADTLGRVLSMTVARRSWEDPDDYWYYCVETAGVAFFFALVGMMETMAPRGRGAVRPSTHPPAAERQARSEVTYGRISRYPPNPFALELPIVLAALWNREGERVSAAAERDG